MEISSEIRQQILQVRRDNPTLTANMSDEDVLELLRQADQAIANERPTAFVVQPSQGAPQAETATGTRDLDRRSMDELVVVGQQLAFAGQWQEAEQAFQALLNKAGQAKNVLYESMALLFQGRLCSDRGDQQRALPLFRQALGLAQQTNDWALLARIYDGLGNAYHRQGNYKAATEHLQYAIEIHERIGDEQGAILSRGNLGNVYDGQGDYEQAVKAFKDVLELANRAGAEQPAGQAYCNLGKAYYRQGLGDLAMDMGLKSLRIALRVGDQLTAANAYEVLGALRSQQGDHATAVQLARKGLEIKERLGMEPDLARGYANLAHEYTRMGDLMLAFLSYDRALAFHERTGNGHGVAQTHLYMGNLYRQQGKSAQARQEYRLAQAAFEAIGECENAAQAARERNRTPS